MVTPSSISPGGTRRRRPRHNHGAHVKRSVNDEEPCPSTPASTAGSEDSFAGFSPVLAGLKPRMRRKHHSRFVRVVSKSFEYIACPSTPEIEVHIFSVSVMLFFAQLANLNQWHNESLTSSSFSSFLTILVLARGLVSTHVQSLHKDIKLCSSTWFWWFRALVPTLYAACICSLFLPTLFPMSSFPNAVSFLGSQDIPQVSQRFTSFLLLFFPVVSSILFPAGLRRRLRRSIPGRIALSIKWSLLHALSIICTVSLLPLDSFLQHRRVDFEGQSSDNDFSFAAFVHFSCTALLISSLQILRWVKDVELAKKDLRVPHIQIGTLKPYKPAPNHTLGASADDLKGEELTIIDGWGWGKQFIDGDVCCWNKRLWKMQGFGYSFEPIEGWLSIAHVVNYIGQLICLHPTVILLWALALQLVCLVVALGLCMYSFGFEWMGVIFTAGSCDAILCTLSCRARLRARGVDTATTAISPSRLVTPTKGGSKAPNNCTQQLSPS